MKEGFVASRASECRLSVGASVYFEPMFSMECFSTNKTLKNWALMIFIEHLFPTCLAIEQRIHHHPNSYMKSDRCNS